MPSSHRTHSVIWSSTLDSCGKIPPHGSNAGAYLVGEVFGARSIFLLNDVDGLYTADPKTGLEAEFIPEIASS